MKKLLSSLALSLLLCFNAFAAMEAGTVWEYRPSSGNANNGGGFVWLSLNNSTYKWTASGSGTNEYYCELAAGGDPSLTEAKCVSTTGNFIAATNGTMGSLAAGAWDWGDNDSLGYSTVYVRLVDGADPDTKAGGFVSMGKYGGIDYSNQDSPQLAITDGTTVPIGDATQVISATAGFTAEMVGNVANVVSGTNAAVGRYTIVAVTDSSHITLDRAYNTGGEVSDAVINIGGAVTTFVNAQMGLWIAGNRAFVKSGTMTLSEAISGPPTGNRTVGFNIYGYNSTRGDSPTSLDRPLIACGAYGFTLSTGWSLHNLQFTTTAAAGTSMGTYGNIINCKSEQKSTTANRVAFTMNTGSLLLNSEGVSMVGYAVSGGAGSRISNCYLHDSARAAYFAGNDYANIMDSVIAECTYGFSATTASLSHTIKNNVFFRSDNLAGTYAIYFSGTGNDGTNIYDNIVTGWETAIYDGEVNNLIIPINNCLYNNTTNFSGLLTNSGNEYGNTFTDPLFNNPQGTLIEDCEDAWNEYAGTGVTATADSGVYMVGTYSAKAAMAASTGVEVIMTEAISSTDMSSYKGIVGWFRSSVALNAGDWQLLLDDSANCASPVVTIPFPAMAANTWYWIYLNNTNFSSATGIISIGLKQAVDKGAMNFYVDGVRAANRDFTVQSGSPVLDAGSQLGTTTGLIGDYKINIGVDQDDNTAGGSVSDVFGLIE